ncbi:hypothetical protein ACFZCF_30045 [Streptomyces sp. NPDC007945]|uniref:hypothetical protein n=1 Tax=Streptomyces sp. NPDC007945 TaxID=3364797 RepID=UPI0036E40CBE
MHRHGRDEILGPASFDHYLAVLAKLPAPAMVTDDSAWGEWRGDRVHEWTQ